VVVTAGPTREYIDAVRFISNPSSGKMGFAMAEAARDARAGGDTRRAVIESVDDAWEVSLLKLAFDTAQRSSGANVGEWRKRGLM
jgi:hypothetical protein